MTRDIRRERQEIDSAVAGRTLCQAFQETAQRYPDRPALRWRRSEGWDELDWAGYRQAVAEATLGLLDLGFRPGEFGLIMARNRPEHLIADLGFMHAGGTPVSVYNTLAPDQLAYVAGHCEATFAVLEDAGFLARFESIRHRLSRRRRVIVLDGSVSADWVTSWSDLRAIGKGRLAEDPDGFQRAWRQVTPDHLASLVYTSGTTGPPKAVMYSQYNAVWTCESSIRWRAIPPFERIVSYLPYAHIAERIFSHWLNLVTASTVSFCTDPAGLLPALLDVRPSAFVGVPRVWEKFYTGINAGMAAEQDPQRRAAIQDVVKLGREAAALARAGHILPQELAERWTATAPYRTAIRAKVGLDQCGTAITSTAPISDEVMEFFYAIGLPLVEVWGQSELTGPATANPPGAIKIGTVGPTLPGVEARLEEDGEILCRGGNAMVGYYKDPEKTAETLTQDGWIRTGDVATVDEDGYFRIIDRKKELIITSYGKNISPANLENLLKQHPLVGQACVIGDRRPYVTALIVLDHEAAPGWTAAHGIGESTVAELSSHPEVRAEVERAVAAANEQVSQVERVKRFTILPEEWTAESEELTPTLKMKRRVVTEKYAAQIDRMYESRVEEAATAEA